MLKEIAFGTHDRHLFVPAINISKYYGQGRDTFTSLFDYDSGISQYVGINRTLSGWDGILYLPDEFILDIDGETPEEARQKAIALSIILEDDYHCPHQPYFSGTGFHLGIPVEAFKWIPNVNLHLQIKKLFSDMGFYDYADRAVIDKTRLIRLAHTRNGKSGLWKIPISKGELHSDINITLGLAEKPRMDFESLISGIDMDAVFDLTSVAVSPTKKYAKIPRQKVSRVPDPIYYTCIQNLLKKTDIEGKRHQIALRLASHFRWRYPEYVVHSVMESWRMQVNENATNEFTENEMDRIIESVYSANGGNGYRYGCNDELMDSECNSVCKMYKAKRNTGQVKTAVEMEKDFISFINNDVSAVDIGKPYGSSFPIYAGEFVILQAPPKSMKTAIVQNIVWNLKRRTYFVETEMSPRQIFQTFLMIKSGENKSHFKRNMSSYVGFSKELEGWFMPEFNTMYADELVKKVSQLPEKPEIIIIDHLHKLKSRRMSGNGDVSLPEISEAIRELTQTYGFIVIAIAEIDKFSIKEGQHNASIKGGVSAIYDANKVLKICNVSRDADTGLIKTLDMKTIYNREEEQFNWRFKIQNKKIIDAEKLQVY